MRFPSLDERLQAAADLFTACDTGADIGADHGRLSCYLLHHQICQRMIVADISADSLSKAERLLSLHELSDRAFFRVADGLDALREHPAQCVAICGMGGRLMSEILHRGKDMLKNADLILSCHTEIPLIRKTVTEINYSIQTERLVRAKGRYYVIMRAVPGASKYSEKELYLGPELLKGREAFWQSYLQWREGVVSCEKDHEKQLVWIREELKHGTIDS